MSQLSKTVDTAIMRANERRELLDAIFEHCTVVFWPPMDDPRGDYPLEHNPRAGKDMREQIEHRLKELVRSAEGKP